MKAVIRASATRSAEGSHSLRFPAVMAIAWALHLVDYLSTEALELRALERLDRKPGKRAIHAELGHPAHVVGRERLAGAQAERDLDRPRALRRARVLTQARNQRPRLVQAVRDPVPSVAQPNGALERGLAGAA